MKLTKKQYDYLMSNTISSIKADSAKLNGFSTAKQCKAMYQELTELKMNRRQDKHNYYYYGINPGLIYSKMHNSSAIYKIPESFGNYYHKKAISILGFYPAHYDLSITIGNDLSVYENKYIDYDGYSRSCKYHMQVWNIRVTLPVNCKTKAVYVNKKWYTMLIESEKTINSLTVYTGKIIVRHYGYEIRNIVAIEYDSGIPYNPFYSVPVISNSKIFIAADTDINKAVKILNKEYKEFCTEIEHEYTAITI